MRVSAIELPLLGSVAAGVPIEAIRDNETVAVPEDFMGRGGEHYVLRVRGDSMIDDSRGLVNNVVNERNANMETQWLRGARRAATVKKLSRGRGRSASRPCDHDAHVFRGHEIAIQGVVIAVMRRYWRKSEADAYAKRREHFVRCALQDRGVG